MKRSGTRENADERAERLARALRENLKRRKAQARARRGGDEDRRPEGLAPPEADDEGPQDSGT